MRLSRRFRRLFPRIVLVLVVACAIGVPTAAASDYYTKSGDVYVGRPVPMPSTHYSKIVGTVPTAAQVRAAQAASSAGNGFDWRLTGITLGSTFAACLLLAGVYTVRRRTRLTPA